MPSKRRALRLYPREFLEQIVGRIVVTQACIYAFCELEPSGASSASPSTSEKVQLQLTMGEDDVKAVAAQA